MKEEVFDAIVIGAGAAGLMAAWELVQAGKKTIVIEAKDRIGGRIHTVKDKNFELPVELGAEFVHGDLKLTKELAKKAGARLYKTNGGIWQKKEGQVEEQEGFIEAYSALNKKFEELKEDISVADFIKDFLRGIEWEEARFTLKNYVEGYYAADTHRVSTFALREELNSSSDEQFRMEGGYIALVDYLYQQCSQKGACFFLSQPVKEIKWEKDAVEVVAPQQKFFSKKVLVTVPVRILQSKSILFSPAIPEIIAAAKKLGFGPVIKTLFQFDEPFWKNKKFTQGKNLNDLSFIFSGSIIPTWWTYHPKNVAMLTGWSGGPHAAKIADLNDQEIVVTALQSLSEIFTIDKNSLRQKLKGWHVANWINDSYSCGGYSYEVVGGSKIKQILKNTVENTLFFAGEGLIDGPEIGTVEAALLSGRETAHQLIARFKN